MTQFRNKDFFGVHTLNPKLIFFTFLESKLLKLDQYFIVLIPISFLTPFVSWLQTNQHKIFLVEDTEVNSSVNLYITNKNVLLNYCEPM